METLKRTVNCGQLTRADVGKRVILNGWVHRHRDFGTIKFVDLRDRYGLTQVVVDEDASHVLKSLATEIKFEYCIAVEGSVRERPKDMVNAKMITGEVEVKVESLSILSRCTTLPFMIDEASDAREELRFKYRFLDLRSLSARGGPSSKRAEPALILCRAAWPAYRRNRIVSSRSCTPECAFADRDAPSRR